MEPIDSEDLYRLIQKRHALKEARSRATDDTWGFWKDPRTIFGVLLTCVFSAGWAAVSWNIRERSLEEGRRDVYETACEASCHRRGDSSMDHIRDVRGTMMCHCLNGDRLIPIPSRLFDSLSGP